MLHSYANIKISALHHTLRMYTHLVSDIEPVTQSHRYTHIYLYTDPPLHAHPTYDCRTVESFHKNETETEQYVILLSTVHMYVHRDLPNLHTGPMS